MIELYPFQKTGVRQIEKFEMRALLGDEQGLGKTIQCLAVAVRNELRPVVVVCPANVKYQWEREAKVHFNLRAEVLEGTRIPPERLLRPRRLIILNYDILAAWLPWLRRLKPELIIGDECQYIKSPAAKRTKAFKKLCKRRPHIILTSGTPLVNRPAELFPALNILMPKEFPTFQPYAFRYCAPRKRFWGWEYKGATNIPELNQRLKAGCLIRRLKKDVLKDLPPQTLITIPVSIVDRKQYETAETNFIKWLREHWGGRRADKAARAERLVQYGYLKRLAAKLKMPVVKEWLDDFLATTEKKIVVFAVHKSIIGDLHETYPNSVIVNGEVTGRKRHLAVEEFRRNKKCRFLFGNIDAAGIGLNLQFASEGAAVELPWTPGACGQMQARISRIGQTENSFFRYFVARNTIEEKLCKLLQEKQEILSGTLDGKGRGNSLDILGALTATLLRKG